MDALTDAKSVGPIRRPLVSAEPVGEVLGVTTSRVYELAALKILPCVRLGRQVRFRPEEIERFIEEGGAALPGGWRKEAQ